MNRRRWTLLFALVVPIGIVILIGVSIAIVFLSSRTHLYSEFSETPSADVAVILGAGVLKNGGLSPVLRDRVDQAIELYREEKVGRIIASGNRSEDYNEVDPIVTYLEGHGIPRSDIITDYAGFDTYATMYRAKFIFGVQSVALVSQSFHLPRAIFIARGLGLDAYGISADRGHYKIDNYVREAFADVKAVGEVLFHRTAAGAKGFVD